MQAYYRVTVRARVDGELQQVYFQEGQNVQKGDLLAQIDPRTYQAQLDQAKAKKAQDEALLANAKLILRETLSLIKNSVIDQQTYDTQKYTADQLQALVQRTRRPLTMRRPSSTIRASWRRSPVALAFAW